MESQIAPALPQRRAAEASEARAYFQIVMQMFEIQSKPKVSPPLARAEGGLNKIVQANLVPRASPLEGKLEGPWREIVPTHC